jgi:hypothetical protein
MPKISTFMYCEEAIGNGQKMQISGPLQIITPLFVPGMFSFAVVFGILDVDLSTCSYSLQVKFLSPQKDEILIDSGVLQLDKQQQSENKLPPEMRGVMFNFDFRNVPFRQEGIYKTVILLNGEEIGEFPIQVKGGET